MIHDTLPNRPILQLLNWRACTAASSMEITFVECWDLLCDFVDVDGGAAAAVEDESRGSDPAPPQDEEGLEVDDDLGFLGHHLQFPKGNEEEVEKAEREYEVIDPRARGARAREEARERKRATRPRDGGRGYRR